MVEKILAFCRDADEKAAASGHASRHLHRVQRAVARWYARRALGRRLHFDHKTQSSHWEVHNKQKVVRKILFWPLSLSRWLPVFSSDEERNDRAARRLHAK